MTKVFVVFCIDILEPESSEILGFYNNKEIAVNNLLKFVGYEEVNNKLTLKRENTDDFPSYKFIYDKVFEEMKFVDYDTIYKVEEGCYSI